jgi:hypothetical protein
MFYFYYFVLHPQKKIEYMFYFFLSCCSSTITPFNICFYSFVFFCTGRCGGVHPYTIIFIFKTCMRSEARPPRDFWAAKDLPWHLLFIFLLPSLSTSPNLRIDSTSGPSMWLPWSPRSKRPRSTMPASWSMVS